MKFFRYLLGSVRVRVTAAALLAVGCALAVSAGLVEVSLSHDRQRVLMTTAQYEAREVAQYNPQLTAPLDLPNATIQTGLVQVIRNGKVLGASRLLRKSPPLWAPGDPLVESLNPLPGAKDVHAVVIPVDDNGIKASIVVVTSLDQFDRSASFIGQLLEVGMPLLLGVVGLICWAMVGRALRPIERMRREVAEVATIRGTDRLAEPATDDEVGRLARTLNTMLDRIAAASERERRFVADASHELRSPIANIRTEIEVALHRPDQADWPSVANDVLGQNQRMTNLVEGLLLLARSDEGSLLRTVGTTDLAAVAEGVVSGISAGRNAGAGYGQASRAGVAPAIVLDASAALVPVPAVYLERMIANLVDNAVRFANTRVVVSVRPVGDQGVIEVSDDGPGVPPAERNRIFERFVRLDEARDRGEGGFGLGLAIVADLCRFYNGTIEVSDAAPGARFVLRFPGTAGRDRSGPAETDANTDGQAETDAASPTGAQALVGSGGLNAGGAG